MSTAGPSVTHEPHSSHLVAGSERTASAADISPAAESAASQRRKVRCSVRKQLVAGSSPSTSASAPFSPTAIAAARSSTAQALS